MAASRVLAMRRLSSRYKYFFYIGATILLIQCLLAYYFLAVLNYSTKRSAVIDNNTIARRLGHNDPRNFTMMKKHLWNIFGDQKHDEDDADFGLLYQASSKLGGGIFDQEDEIMDKDKSGGRYSQNFPHYLPLCNITEKKALSAISRTKTVRCRQQVSNVACLNSQGKLYPLYLPRFCTLKGNNSGNYLGCFKDLPSNRDLEAGFQQLVKNSPDICINHCLRGGSNYAGLQNGNECWCGESYGIHGKVQDDECSVICPGYPGHKCGGHFVSRIFQTAAGMTVKHPAPLLQYAEGTATSQVKIVFVLTLNGRAVRQVIRLLRAIYHDDHYYFIHVDKRQEFMFRELLPLEKRLRNFVLTRNRFATIWGGSSLLQAHLSFMQELLEKSEWQWDYYVNLSESDYPIKSMQTLTAYLTSYNGMNFLKSHGRDTPLFIKKQGLDQTFVECENHLWLLGPRTLPNGVRIDGGSDWFGLYRDFVRYVVMETDDLLDGLKQMYKYSLLPAESFFHTVLLNSRFCGRLVDNNLHLTNWRRKQGCRCQYRHIVDWCGCSPNVFKVFDMDRLMKYKDRPIFFGRKFEPVVDQKIIAFLDIYLSGHLQQDLVALARYWQNEFHYMDKAPHDNKDVQLTFYFSFIRLASNDCHRRYNSCRFQPLSLLAVNLLFENDHFRGLLVQFKARNIISGMEAVVESHLHPRYYNNFTDRFLGKSRLQFLEVGSGFDPKELIFRNFGKLLGPYDDICLRHVWHHGDECTVSMAWIDPTNVIAASYDIQIPANNHVGQHKPQLSKPIRPGVWSLKIMTNLKVFAETRFLVTPLTFFQGRPITASAAHEAHSGPHGLYTSKDFSALRSVLGIQNNVELIEKSASNAEKIGRYLEPWVDELVSLFWTVKDSCVAAKSGTCPFGECHKSNWSSQSPDPKSDIQTIGLKAHVQR